MTASVSFASPSSLTKGRSIQVREAWLGKRREAILDPSQPIIDPHHHLWYRPGLYYMPDDLLADIGMGHNVVATVHVQARSMYYAKGPEELRPVGETAFAATVADANDDVATALCAGIVAYADLRLGRDVEKVLDAHHKAGKGRLRGIRHITAWDADPMMVRSGNPAEPHLMEDAEFRKGFSVLASRGLSYDAWLYHSQLGELEDLARAFPETQIVCDHAGGPIGIGGYANRRREVFQDWSRSIRSLARCGNVALKFGGLGMLVNGFDFHLRAEPPSSEQLAEILRPYFEVCVDAFGAERCMFESNFPVDKGSYSYDVFWNACKILADGATPGEKGELFLNTAARVYRLEAAASKEFLSPRLPNRGFPKMRFHTDRNRG